MQQSASSLVIKYFVWYGAGVYGYAGADGRPFAAASVKHGIVVGEVSLHSLPSHRQSEDGRSPSSYDKVCVHGTNKARPTYNIF